MIDLERLLISSGDIVKRKNGNYQPFRVLKAEIDPRTMIQMIYPEIGPPIPSTELEVVRKSDSLTLSQKNKIALESLLNEMYGDNWDIIKTTPLSSYERSLYAISPSGTGYLLLIYYPEIDISNSKNEHHHIRDLYIKLELDYSYKLKNVNPYGLRATLTEGEIKASYCHSHLSVVVFTTFSRFCTGGDIIDDVIIITSQTNPHEDIIQYEVLFETLNGFIAWESIEGGPYRRIANIKDNIANRSSASYSSSISSKNTLYRLMKQFNFKIPYQIKLNCEDSTDLSNILEITSNTLEEELKKFILDNILELPPSVVEDIFVEIINYNYYKISASDIIDLLNPDEDKDENKDEEEKFYFSKVRSSGMCFRDKPIEFYKVTSSKEKSIKTISLSSLIIKSSILTDMINKLNLKFYEELLNEEESFFRKLASNYS